MPVVSDYVSGTNIKPKKANKKRIFVRNRGNGSANVMAAQGQSRQPRTASPPRRASVASELLHDPRRGRSRRHEGGKRPESDQGVP
jgi:hypothetical protein